MNIYDRKEIYRLEPLIPLFLSIHGVAILSYFSHPGWRWLLVVATALVAATATSERSTTLRGVAARAWATATIALLLISSTGMTGSFFTLWCFVLSATYPVIIPSWQGMAIPALLSLAYGSFYFFDPFPVPPLVIFSRCIFMIFVGAVTHSFGKGLIRLAEAEHLASTDPLTGLYNRRYFFMQGKKEMERAKRSGLPMAVLLMDCDDFKLINDHYGHEVGDKVLRNLGGCIRRVVRKIDMPARIGGDELGVILPGTDKSGAASLRRRLEEAITSITIDAGGDSIVPSVSIGIGVLGADTPSFQDILSAADHDMYQKKRSKKA